MLWAHDAKRERRLVVEPDSEGQIKSAGLGEKADRIWNTATRAHYNRDLRFNSQSLIVAMTERPCIGGTAWPSVIFEESEHEYAFALWCNSTLGLLMHWWVTNKTQSGRGRTTVTGIPSIPTLDVRTLTGEQLAAARAAFEDLRERRLLPFDQIDEDPGPRGTRPSAARGCPQPAGDALRTRRPHRLDKTQAGPGAPRSTGASGRALSSIRRWTRTAGRSPGRGASDGRTARELGDLARSIQPKLHKPTAWIIKLNLALQVCGQCVSSLRGMRTASVSYDINDRDSPSPQSSPIEGEEGKRPSMKSRRNAALAWGVAIFFWNSGRVSPVGYRGRLGGRRSVLPNIT